MTTEEHLEKLERELAGANRRNRRLIIGAGVCLAVIVAWTLVTSKAGQTSAYAATPTTTSTSAPASSKPAKDFAAVASKPATAPSSKPTSTVPITYCIIPLHGEIGLEVTNDLVKQSLSAAKAARVGIVVFDIDSPGGLVTEEVAILQTIRDFKDLRIVAYVYNAASAAAMISMSCPEIVMQRTGAIGAAVTIIRKPNGAAEAVADAKFLSWERAGLRAAIDVAGHNFLLAEGMQDIDLVLSVILQNGKPVVIEGDNGKLIKAKGKILTLTGQEAVDSGLAIGLANSIKECLTCIGVGNAVEASRVTTQAKTLFEERSKTIKYHISYYKILLKQAEDSITDCQHSNDNQDLAYNSIKKAAAAVNNAAKISAMYPALQGETFDDPVKLKAVAEQLEERAKEMERERRPSPPPGFQRSF